MVTILDVSKCAFDAGRLCSRASSWARFSKEFSALALGVSGCDNPRLDGGGGHFGPLVFLCRPLRRQNADCRGSVSGLIGVGVRAGRVGSLVRFLEAMIAWNAQAMGLAIDCDDLRRCGRGDRPGADDAGGDELEQQAAWRLVVGQVASLVGGSAMMGDVAGGERRFADRRWGTGGPVLGKSAWPAPAARLHGAMQPARY